MNTVHIGDCRDVMRSLIDDGVRVLSEAQIAYLAGLIDGEGSLECQRDRGKRSATDRFTLRLSFTFATEEPLRTIWQRTRDTLGLELVP